MQSETLAEAAVWVARLHGPNRSTAMERECLAWQARSETHRAAFERCTDTWQEVAGITLSSYAAGAQAGGTPNRWTLRPAGWAAALVLAGLVAVSAVTLIRATLDGERYATAVGEQQTVLLADGTRMTLNTATQVKVDLATHRRTVRLEGGEVLFEVAKDTRRPFVVQASGSEVVALGTVFAVRLTPRTSQSKDSLAVTLIDGVVTVQASSDEGGRGLVPVRSIQLAAGERLRLNEASPATLRPERQTLGVDRPRIEQLMAWRRNEAVFDDAPLADAVAEMNRYSRRPIVLVGEAMLADRRVSGLFVTNDIAGFARAVALLHDLVVREFPDRLEISGG